MPRRIILLSGRVSAGKTTLADALVSEFGAHRFKTKSEIETAAASKISPGRRGLQNFGEALDRRTGGEWVAEALSKRAESLPADSVIVVDSVRIVGQIAAVRRAYGSRVVHVHLGVTNLSVLEERYKRKQRHERKQELGSYAELSQSPTERNVDRLAKTADVFINTEKCTKADVLVRAAARLGLYGKEQLRLVDVLVGGAYGSEGKGHIASYLAPEYDILVRVGGPNAGHKVYEDPQPYVHHLLPSGTRRCTAGLMIAAGAVLNVEQLRKEIAECQVNRDRLTIDPQAMIIEQSDCDFEKATLVGSIGSTGQGVGSATSRKILRGAQEPVRLAKDMPELLPFVRDTRSLLDKAFREGRKVFLEGTQGVGLSLHHGRYPHVTSRDTTVSGCLSEAGIPPTRVRRIVMVCRTFPIRVKSPSKERTSGYMAQQLTWQDVADRSGYDAGELEKAEHTSTTNKLRRVGEFEWDLFRRAISLNGPTDIALSFVDYLDRNNTKARRFDQLSDETIRFVEEIERVACAPVSLISTRFNYRSIIDRRTW